MNSYTEYLNKKVMEQAWDIGYLRGTLKGILNIHSGRLPEHVLEYIRESLKKTEGEPETSEIPVEHNGSPQVEVFEEEDEESAGYTG